MTKHYCDRCEEEVLSSVDLHPVKVIPDKNTKTQRIFEICDRCHTQLLDWFEQVRRDKMNPPVPIGTPSLWGSDLD